MNVGFVAAITLLTVCAISNTFGAPTSSLSKYHRCIMHVIERRDYFVALTVRDMAPTYISDSISIRNEVAIRDTGHSTSPNLVTLPYATLDIFKNSFAYRGPFIWNALPDNIRKCVTLPGFKVALKAHVLTVRL